MDKKNLKIGSTNLNISQTLVLLWKVYCIEGFYMEMHKKTTQSFAFAIKSELFLNRIKLNGSLSLYS